MIAIIDYGAGNLRSVEKALHAIGEPVLVTRKPSEIRAADRVILPGVGAFGDAVEHMQKYDLIEPIRAFVNDGKPFLGICLGMQLLFERSEESSGVDGLGLLKGEVLRFPTMPGLKVPHMGWNSLDFQNDGQMFRPFGGDPYVYFVHSYYLQAVDASVVKATSNYGRSFHAAVEHENIFGCQFHPEKSSANGLKLLQRFAKMR